MTLAFLIDKITNSIEDVATGKGFDTEVLAVITTDLKLVLKKMDGDLIGKKNLCILTGSYLN
jgi:hypothetical protein